MDITLRKRKDAAQLVISGAENTRFFWDTFRLYAQNESTLRLCSPAFQKKLLPLLGRQVNYPDGKPISEDGPGRYPYLLLLRAAQD